jgi:hypothetical protein
VSNTEDCARCRLKAEIDEAAERATQAGISILEIIAILEFHLKRWQERYLILESQR